MLIIPATPELRLEESGKSEGIDTARDICQKDLALQCPHLRTVCTMPSPCSRRAVPKLCMLTGSSSSVKLRIELFRKADPEPNPILVSQISGRFL